MSDLPKLTREMRARMAPFAQTTPEENAAFLAWQDRLYARRRDFDNLI